MKKILFSLLIGASAISYAQCTVDGPSKINVGEEAVYQVPTEYAQCEDCYQWKTIGALSVEGDNRKNEVKVSSKQGGNMILGVTMLTPNGVEQCTKNIVVVSNGTSEVVAADSAEVTHEAYTSNKIKVDCNINVTDFKEVKYVDHSVAFFPNTKKDNFTYKWEVKYVNGTSDVSTEKVATFTNPLANVIEEVNLTVTSTVCLKKFSKKYTKGFWEYLNQK